MTTNKIINEEPIKDDIIQQLKEYENLFKIMNDVNDIVDLLQKIAMYKLAILKTPMAKNIIEEWLEANK